MNVWQSLQIALAMLARHKLRAFLTMLGVIIGVMSVTMIVMISSGFQAYISAQFKDLGTNTLFVFFDPGRRMRGQTVGRLDGLTTNDLTYILQRVHSVDMASGVMSPPVQKIVVGNQEFDSPKLYGTDEKFEQLNHFNVIMGRALTKADIDSYANVCLIGEDIRDRLFPGQDPIGKYVTMSGIALRVIGLIEKKSFLGDSTARLLQMPITTAQRKWVGGNKLDFALFRARPDTPTEVAKQDVWEALMVKTGNKPLYRVDSSDSILKVFTGVIGVTGAVLAAIAALSLLVGGIGIMNIMLVSVTERTREIGLRKAVGARRSAILTQFLIEAATLSLVGGLIGMGIAYGLGQVVSLVTLVKHWPTKGGLETPFPLTAGLMSALFSAAIGIVFGFYPAMSASKLDPIVALRTE